MTSDSNKHGLVKFYNPTKGFGFIYEETNKIDVFFHITDIYGGNPPKVGDKVSFTKIEKNGRQSACNIIINTNTNTNTNSEAKKHNITTRRLQGFPCISGDSVKGFRINKSIKPVSTRAYDTVDEAKNELIKLAQECGANAILNYIWHRESDWSDDRILLIVKIGRSRKTTFWAEGNAVHLIQSLSS